jgi:TonB-dependent receptor
LLGIAALALASPAVAQSNQPPADASPTDIGDIVIIGRNRVDTPQAQIKRQSDAIVDSVTMQDIENTTDTTLPDALSRVAGVSVDPFYGTSDSGYATIRGFSSIYNSMDIDGNPIWFSSQNNRAPQMGLIPSAIIKETSVYKTVTPEQDANSIGGHISMRTLRAFDGGDRPYLSLGGRIGAYESSSSITGGPSYRFYGATKTTFGSDHQFGVVLGFNTQRMLNSDRYGGVDTYVQVSGQDMVNANLYDKSIYDKKVTTNAVFGKLEYRSSDRLYAFLSGTWLKDTRLQYLDRVAATIYQTSGRTQNYQDGTADFTNGIAQTKEYDYVMEREAKILGAGLDYQINDKGSLSLRGNYTDYVNDIITRYPETFQLQNIAGSYDINGDYPRYTIANEATYDDPSNWVNRNTTASYIRDQNLHDKVLALKADFNQNTFVGARGLGFAAGVNWTRLNRTFNQDTANYLLPKGSKLLLSQVIPSGVTMANNDAVKMNWDAFWDYITAHATPTYDNALSTDYRLVEDEVAGYGSLYYSLPRFRFIAGLRYEFTRDDDRTGNVVSGVQTPVHWQNSYGNWLPNVQASYDFTDRLRVRSAFTKTIGRPDFSSFAPGQSITLDANGNPVITGSNPKIAPRVSTNYDLSLEYYFRDGFVSLAVFHKDLAHMTFTQRTQQTDANGLVVLTQQIPLDTGSAHLTGVEFSFDKERLGFLPSVLGKFGVHGNFTYLNGRYTAIFTDGSHRTLSSLGAQPKWVANLGVSYLIGAARINVDYQAKGRTFSGTFGTTAAGDLWFESVSTLNAQATLKIMKNFRLVFEARNLTNSSIVETTGVNNSPYNSVGSGRSFFGGFSYKF